MKFIYITDVHGDPKKYDKLIEIAKEKGINTIINGGDMMPKKKKNRMIFQKDYIENILPDYFDRLNREGLEYYVMLGNDDLEMFDETFDKLCSRYPNINNIDSQKVKIGDYEIIGMNKVLDTPYPRKERIVNEDNFSPDFEVLPDGFKYIDGEYQFISDWPEELKKLPKMKDILDELPYPEDMDKTIYVFHDPPAHCNLGRLAKVKDHDVGSNDILEFIKLNQPAFTFHGHIHESPLIGGDYFKQIGKTISIQPGQTEYGDDKMFYVIVDLDSKTFSREVVDV